MIAAEVLLGPEQVSGWPWLALLTIAVVWLGWALLALLGPIRRGSAGESARLGWGMRFVGRLLRTSLLVTAGFLAVLALLWAC